MAGVEGFSRVNKDQGAGTGEAFMLGESKALKTYVDQEQTQIKEKKKAEDDALAREIPDYGWFYTDEMNKEITAYKNAAYEAMNRDGEISTNQDLTRQFQNLQQKAITTKKITGRLDELNKASGQELWAENAEFFDKSLFVREMKAKLTNPDGTPKDPSTVNVADLEDIYQPNAFLTNKFVDKFVTNIKDQFVDAKTGVVAKGYGEYIQSTEKGIRFVTKDAQGNIIDGVSDNVAQLALDNPIYFDVIGKKADAKLEEWVQSEIANGADERETRDIAAIKKKEQMMDLAKEDILAYQQLSTKADLKLSFNKQQTKINQQEANRKQQELDFDKNKEAYARAQKAKENQARVNADPSLTPTDYTSSGGGKTNILSLANIGVPNNKIGKDGKNQPLQLTPTSVFYIDGVTKDGGSAIEGATLSVRGKQVDGQTLKAQDRTGSGTATYIPIKTKAALMDAQGNLVSYNDPDSKTSTDDMNEFRNKEGYTVNLVMEAQEVIGYDDKGVPNKFRTVLLPITNDNSGSNILNYNNFNDLAEAQNAIDQVAGAKHNWGDKSSMQGFKAKEAEKAETTTTKKVMPKYGKSKSGNTIPIE